MNDMLKRVARVLCDRIKHDGYIWYDYIPDARAVIAAMRDCTPEMLDAGSAAHPAGGYKRETLLNDIIECEWRAMVDAALGQE